MTIQQLSQEIGIGVDTLRIWERRYGFPVPGRDGRGHRSYDSRQLEELRMVKKLVNYGQRPGKVFALTLPERRALLNRLSSGLLPDDERLQYLIQEMSPQQIALELASQRNKLGLRGFIKQKVLPLLQLLDHGWTIGQLSIAREHLVTDQLEESLKRELATSIASHPQVVFVTLSGERHKIGLLLAAALFRDAGLQVLWLSEDLPLSEIPGLASDLGVTGVALSFSGHYAPRQAKQDLRHLRQQLDPRVKIIAGGHTVQQMRSLPNLLICNDLDHIPQLVDKHFRQDRNQEAVR